MDNIKEYIMNIINNVNDENTLNIFELSENIYKILEEKYYDIKKEVSKEKVYQIIKEIQQEQNTTKKELGKDNIVQELTDTYRNKMFMKPSLSLKNDKVIDVYSEIKDELLPKYISIGDIIVNNKINISNSEINKEAQLLIEIINKESKDIMQNLIPQINEILSSISEIEGLDSEIKDVDLEDFDFNDWEKVKSRILSSKFNLADQSFFQPQENVQGNYYFLEDGDVTYKYDIKNHNLYINGKDMGKVYISIPEGVSDYSKLNTITMLTGKDSDGEERKKDVNGEGNSVIISFDNADSNNLKISSTVASITKFVNKVAKTDLSNCQNIIAGGSRFGARSLKIAADSGDLYQTVVCVNNAVLVNGQNSDGGGKEAFASEEDLKKLDGKNIYFISSKNDPNIYKKSGNVYVSNNNVKEGYVYTGLELTTKNCPNSQIYFISNNSDSAFEELKDSNYHYRADLWKNITNEENIEYSEHQHLHNILSDLCTSNLVGYNGYTKVNTDIQYKAESDNHKTEM